ncbi:hypothetical protein DFH07DRAFT_778945 [Mycena maculata]|uniref:Uncharacterized protein n=1 Tax=Mycena maculata TaxID=230809 RepID=A0AAD7IAD8_9AGAR|nr:hypothetical protein DFH07DRAFT_778945 [Mycena maculata]
MCPWGHWLVGSLHLTRKLGNTIQTTEDPLRMEELLGVNDELTALVTPAPALGQPTLMLQGLGFKWTPGAPLASPASEDGSIKKLPSTSPPKITRPTHSPPTFAPIRLQSVPALVIFSEFISMHHKFRTFKVQQAAVHLVLYFTFT